MEEDDVCQHEKSVHFQNNNNDHRITALKQSTCVTYIHTHAHTFNGPLSGTTRVSRYQKGKTNLDFTEARDSEWQWHQLGYMQVCTLLQTDNHTNRVKALKAIVLHIYIQIYIAPKIVITNLRRCICVSRHLQLRSGGFLIFIFSFYFLTPGNYTTWGIKNNNNNNNTNPCFCMTLCQLTCWTYDHPTF